MDLKQLEQALQPYEEELRAQEKRRRFLGVREVDRPTYEKYIIGPIERYDRHRNAFVTLFPNNPYGEEIRRQFKERTGYDNRDSLPYSELEPTDRIGQSISTASWRLCREHHPDMLPVTPPEGQVEVTDKAWMSRLVKKVGLMFGAEMVRITRVDPRWVYTDFEISHKYAIVAVVHHARHLNDLAPSHAADVATGRTYSGLKFITTQLADFIRGLGHDAAYREVVGPHADMLMVPTGIDAGVGEFARNGRILSPEFGINMRLEAVTTDLPLEVDKPISFGVHEFCLACEECAVYCPPRAIPFGPPTDTPVNICNNAGFRKWYVDAPRCLAFWASNKQKWNSCGRCITVCPWNKPLVPFHNIVRWIAVHSPAMVKKTLVSADKQFSGRTKKKNGNS